MHKPNLKTIPETIYKYKNPLKILGLILLIVFLGYHLYFSNKVIPGVYIGKVSVGGLTFDEAKKRLTDSIKDTDKTIKLKYEEKEYKVSDTDILLEYKVTATLSRAFEVGRTGNFLVDNKDKLAGLIKPLKLKAFYDFDDNSLSNKLLSIRGELDKPEKESTYELDGKDLKITESENGYVVDGTLLGNNVINMLDSLSFEPLEILMKSTSPKIRERHLEILKEQAKTIVYKDIRIKYENKIWDLTPEQKLQLISVKVDEENNGNPELRINKLNFDELVQTLGLEVNTLPKGKVAELRDNRVISFKLIEKGKEIDAKKFYEDFRKTVFTDENEVLIATREITEDESTNRYGINALLGEGSSKYTGSIKSRIHNLTLAAERAGNVLVAPGGIYSLNKTIGEISAKTGYDSAYIISNGRTVLGEGGGVCQTSTTLFRAVLNAGLPVVTRYPHAYRVKYYELDSKPGLDAAIFQPSLDFQFKNDTDNYILVESSWNLEEDSLTFKIYGSPDKRTVEITEPVVSGITAPPAALYIDDPNLAAGVIRQVDFPAWGASVSFNRKVLKDGKILHDDTFNSRYQAWRAIYLKGTKK